MAVPMDIHLQMRYADFEVDVDISLPGSGVTALYGPSGSGKTTCLRCIAGLEKAQHGVIRVNGETWQDTARGVFVPPHKRSIGYVFQEASLFSHLSVSGNLAFGFKRIPRGQQHLQPPQAAELLGIDHLLQRRVDTLSGGERQRVGIARALLTSPGLMLFDEPLSALDTQRKNEILPYLERLHGELDIPMLYVSHAQDEVARLADHLVLLDQGKVLASGPISETLARLDLPLALGDDAGVTIEGTATAYDAHYQLLSLALPHSELAIRVAHRAIAPGTRLRIKIGARDVSLNLLPDGQSSILNRLPVRVVGHQAADNGAHVTVRLDACGTPILARITRFSFDQLQIHTGQAMWAQIKAVAVLA
ncbi:molybdenum ABC transporter ATP-binding protein [Pseudomonas sp. v388]|uniref:molybdenum ABC transporter ATP-binding protein n=1 Tax=Pseudomonas sp. v388 TaxID=2479849 RepID=UPI000F7845E6|nr:molybdenum ABC transporter ATP-binding protein [Pseudomonas sp. v388]RRV10728.1 molybdenum ABC transporter ATP-binding protein [Pseudomonas sp. v388]